MTAQLDKTDSSRFILSNRQNLPQLAVIALFLMSLFLGVGAANAAPVPAVPALGNQDLFIGDPATFTYNFSNSGPDTGYGPFIELALGFLFISGKFLQIASVMTILILAVTTVGVIQRLKSKSQFQCACLGAVFSLPLSYVTVFENGAMIFMASLGVFGLV